MGTTLEGKQINQTYQGLLKTTDNNEVGSSAKEITDGKGNGTGVTLDNSGNLVANATVTANAFVGDGSQLTNVPYPVTSVNTQTGDVVLDTDDIAEGSNEYYTDAKVEANSAVAANTLKVGITSQQTADILTNNDKVGLLIFTDQIELFITPRKGRRHVLRLIRDLLAFEPTGHRTNLKLGLETLNHMLKRRSIIFLLSEPIEKYAK